MPGRTLSRRLARASSCAAATTCTCTSSPTWRKRRIDDLALARRFVELGLAGFVLKSHYVPTAERAAVVCAAVPGIDALGAIALNAGVGGLNAQAVEIAARGGARIVWLPTVDSENEASEDGPKPAKQPVWRKIQDEFIAAGVGAEPVRLTAEGLASVLGVVARHELVLATGHLARAEIHTVVDARCRRDHARRRDAPDYPTQGVPVDEQRELAGAAPSSSAASRRSTPARSRGRRPSRRSARPGARATCSRPISARSPTRRSRTGSR